MGEMKLHICASLHRRARYRKDRFDAFERLNARHYLPYLNFHKDQNSITKTNMDTNNVHKDIRRTANRIKTPIEYCRLIYAAPSRRSLLLTRSVRPATAPCLRCITVRGRTQRRRAAPQRRRAPAPPSAPAPPPPRRSRPRFPAHRFDTGNGRGDRHLPRAPPPLSCHFQTSHYLFTIFLARFPHKIHLICHFISFASIRRRFDSGGCFPRTFCDLFAARWQLSV